MKKKLCFAFAVMIFMLGVWGTLTRKDPIEKSIGYTYVSDGENTNGIKGYKAAVSRGGKIRNYEYPEIKEVADKLYKVSVTPETSSRLTVSYSKEHYGDVYYSLYDSGFNTVSENETQLNVPTSGGELYYVSLSVLWGNEKENVNMIYYFVLQT